MLLVASFPLDLWRWWPSASWPLRAEVLGAVLAFVVFHAAVGAFTLKSLIHMKYLLEEGRRIGPRRRPWWTIWIGRPKR
jgi:hypothetical protein